MLEEYRVYSSFNNLTVVADAFSRAGRDVASDVAGRFALVVRGAVVVPDRLLPVVGREARD